MNNTTEQEFNEQYEPDALNLAIELGFDRDELLNTNNMNRQFHNNRITNIAISVLVYGITVFIGVCLLLLVNDLMHHGSNML